MEAAITISRRSRDLLAQGFEMSDSQQIQNNWSQIKTQVLAKWNKLSEADIEKTKGNANSLNKLVASKYGEIADFDEAYEKMCMTSNKKTEKNDIEYRSPTAPAAEAGMPASSTESVDDTFHAGSPERRSNHNFAEVENTNNFSHETDDELSAYTPGQGSRSSLDGEESAEFINLNKNEKEMQFTAPDEFTPSQDPSPSREDITLGRNTSSAHKISTAQAESYSSDVSSKNDAKKI